MRLFLIGHSVVDQIIHKDGTRQNEIKPGGLWHSVNGILPLLGEEDQIFPVTMVSDETMQVYGRNYQSVSQEYFTWREKVPKVTLTLLNDKERLEDYSNLQESLSIDSIPFETADGILLNMITGFDISREDLALLRSKTSCLIYMDIHSLARGVADGYSRPLRKIDHAEEWLALADVIQCNEAESGMLFDEADEQKLASRVLSCGPEVLIITKGSTGARAYFKHRSETASVFISAEQVAVFTEVGCGDVFGSAFFFHFAKTGDVTRSLINAVKHSGEFVKTGFGL